MKRSRSSPGGVIDLTGEDDGAAPPSRGGPSGGRGRGRGGGRVGAAAPPPPPPRRYVYIVSAFEVPFDSGSDYMHNKSDNENTTLLGAYDSQRKACDAAREYILEEIYCGDDEDEDMEDKVSDEELLADGGWTSEDEAAHITDRHTNNYVKVTKLEVM